MSATDWVVVGLVVSLVVSLLAGAYLGAVDLEDPDDRTSSVT